jgi:hypothetical protein
MARCVWVLAILLWIAPSHALAEMRESFEDAEVVARSELVVVAHLQPGSVTYVAHPPSRYGASWEHHATLVITATLKGKPGAKEIPIIIHFGITPFLEGRRVNDPAPAAAATGWPKGSIQLIDTGGSAVGAPILEDAAQDNLWFLRRLSGIFGREPGTGTGDFGIVDPEDARPLTDKAYLALYLGANPEAAIRTYVAAHAEVGATRYLEHLEVQRILKVRDRRERVEKLIPYFLRSAAWGHKWGAQKEAMDGIIAAGPEASGPRLLAMFATADPHLRTDIMTIWRRTRFKGAVKTLIGVLDETDRFWAEQQLTKGWWNSDVDSALTIERRDRYADVYEAVLALGAIGDARATAAVNLTLQRWTAPGFDDRQIIEACTSALATFTR